MAHPAGHTSVGRADGKNLGRAASLPSPLLILPI